MFGHVSYSQIKKSNGRIGGKGFAITGRVLGWLGMASVILLIVGSVGFFAFGNLNENLVYYLTPSEAVAQRADFPDGALCVNLWRDRLWM
ncbi:MAG TPA: hypothetical protein ENH00_03225 [Actinobacteria bacterium]|nr:hypothetical protein [Actinomycetota bacterium]